MLESFEFVLILTIWEQILRPFYVVSKKLQSVDSNLHNTCEYLQSAITIIQHLRENNCEELVISATHLCNSRGISVNNDQRRQVG